MPEIVVKRDGREEPFLSFKIDDAIKKAYTSVGQLHNPNILNKVLEKLHGDKINIEDIQDTIEEVLYNMGTYKVLKSFIQYRQIHKLQRDISNSDKENATFIDCNETIDEYVGKTDWRINANSNASYSHAGMINNTSGKVIANYWLNKVLTKKQSKLHRDGFIHVHDLDFLSPYCFIGSTKVKLYDGTSKTFLELTKEWDRKNKPFEVVSVNRYGLFEKGTARAPRLIKKDADLVEVMLSNGKSEICTPDHEFMLLNNTYKQAQYLRPNDVLKTCYKFVDDELDLVDIYVKDVKTLDYKEDVYCLTVDRYHNFMLDTGIIVKNCGGWSLRAVLDEGFNGLRGRAEARAPKHTMEGMLQAANFLSCFTGDTEVILANGKKMRMEDMAKYKDKVWMVKGYDSQTDQVLPTELYNVHETRKVTELIELEFEDGDKVNCTLDHKFYTTNKGYVEAKDLTEEDDCFGYSVLNDQKQPKMRIKSKRIYQVESTPVYCGTVITKGREHAFFVNDGKLVRNCMSLEWAGAQAFSSFDTYFSPYVFRDQLSDKELYRNLRSFVYNLNVPSKWGQCVPDTYKCLKADGKWVSHKDLKVGDKIYVFDIDTNTIKTDTIQRVNLFDKPEVMHRYTVKDSGIDNKEFHFDVTDQHRVIIKHTEKGNYQLIESNKIDIKEPISSTDRYYIPTYENNVLDYEEVISKEEVKCNYDQVWCPTTATGTFICQTDEGNVFITGNSPFTNITLDITVPEDLKEQIPTREQHHIFSDITPDHPDYDKLTKLAQERGRNKLTDMTYKDFLPEMERIVIAYYKVMTEGDAKGRPFTFPIPTINVTENFKWDSKVSDAIFENAALRGSSYFQNFIGSQYIKDENGNLVPNEKAYKPGHVRSMCPLTKDTLIDVKILNSDVSNNGLLRNSYLVHIGDMVDNNDIIYKVYTRSGWKVAKPVSMPNTRVLRITIETDDYIDMGINHLQPVLIDGKEVSLHADELDVGMLLPINKARTFTKTDKIEYVKITSIEEIEYKDKLYCVEIQEGDDKTFMLANGVFTHNCRLQINLEELLKRGGGLFGSAEMTGGVSNTTINLAILGYLHKGDREALFKHLDEILEECKDISERRRKAVIEWYERGLYPYTKRYLPNFNHHFSIIGANGCNELIRNFTNDKEDIGTEYGQQLAYDITEYIREKIKVFQKETGNLYNFEASPGESAQTRFARESLKRHPDIITAGTTQQPYFTNSTQLPVNYTDDVFKALDLQDKLQCQYTGGTVLHVYMDNYLPNKDSAKLLVKKILTNYTLPYITLTPTNRICPKHGLVEYDNDGYCPECDKEILEKHKDELI